MAGKVTRNADFGNALSTSLPKLPNAIATFRNGVFYLDQNNNRVWNSSGDATYTFGTTGDLPLTSVLSAVVLPVVFVSALLWWHPRRLAARTTSRPAMAGD